jgi:hypothetical protein
LAFGAGSSFCSFLCVYLLSGIFHNGLLAPALFPCLFVRWLSSWFCFIVIIAVGGSCDLSTALGLDACFNRGQLNEMKRPPHQLVAAWMSISLTCLISYFSWVLVDILTESSACSHICQQKLSIQIFV